MRLFRYRAFNPEFLAREIGFGQIYFWNLLQQNDLLEGQVAYDCAVTVEGLVAWLSSMRQSISTLPTGSTWLFGESAGPMHGGLKKLVAGASDESLLVQTLGAKRTVSVLNQPRPP